MKRGFTLSEVLITLAIIGVVAAITLPSLMTNVQNRSIGSALAKGYNTLSNANDMLLATTGLSSIGDATANSPETYVTTLKNYARFSSFPTAQLPAYTDYNYGEYTVVKDSTKASVSNDGIIYIFNPPSVIFTVSDKIQVKPDLDYSGGVAVGGAGPIINSGVGNINPGIKVPGTGLIADNVLKKYQSTFDVYIDVNGQTGPNALGRDLFLFIINDDGTLVPYGGAAYNEYTGKDEGSEPLWATADNACYKDSTSKTVVKDGKACAGKVADDGWKVLY